MGGRYARRVKEIADRAKLFHDIHPHHRFTIVAVTDVKGGTTEFTYDQHLMTSLTDSLENTQNTNIYDGMGRVVEQEDAIGGIHCFYYGHGSSYTSANCSGSSSAPSAGETITVDPRGNETLYQHDTAFRTTAVQDPLGNVTVYTYEASGALCSPANKGNLCSIKDPLEHVTSFTYDSAGNVLTTTDADSNVWEYTYNAFNQVLTAEDPLGRTTTNTYDGDGNLTAVENALLEETVFDPNTDGTLNSVTDSLTNETTYGYDSYGNVTSKTDPLLHTWVYTYDLGGRLETETDPLDHVTTYTYDDQNNVQTIEDDLGNLTTYTYDAKGQRTAITDANRAVVGAAEAGADCGAAGTGDGVDDDTDSAIDDGCPNVLFEYDEAGRLTEVTDAEGGAVVYTYDGNGNRTSITNARNKTTDYEYDDANELITVTDPLDRDTVYDYDEAGRRSSRIDGNLDETVYSYDVLGRLTSINYTVGTPDVTFTYDELGNRLTRVDGTGTTTYSYDALYRTTEIEDGASNVVGYDYDEAGRLIELTYPGGTDSVAYGYDEAGRLASVTDWLTNETTYTYDDANRLITTNLGNGLISDRGYDDANRLLSVTNRDGGTLLSEFAYMLDAVGNRLEMVDDSGTTGYEYDALYRLTGVTYPNSDTTDYTYDLQGNRLTMVINGGSAIDYTYDDADQMTDVEGVSYSYDNNGNQTDAGSDTFGWDHQNRLTATNIDSVSASYEYNADGLRTSRTHASATVDYVWDENSGLPAILEDANGDRFIYGLDLLTRINGSTEEWYLHDGLGSTVGLTDSGGAVSDSYTYDAFGAQNSHNGSSGQELSFTGEQADPSGLQYLRARYYDPVQGRFLSPDPIKSSPNSSQYLYVGNNPASYIDPSGECRVEIGSRAAGASSGAPGIVGERGEHAYIVTTDPITRARMLFAGGKDGGVEIFGFPFGASLVAHANHFDEAGESDRTDYLSNGGHTIRDKEGESCGRINLMLTWIANLITEADLGYSTFSRNSNSVVRELLENAGLPQEDPGNHIGWGTELEGCRKWVYPHPAWAVCEGGYVDWYQGAP
jgi:RHS repeat-associated protein